MVNQMTAPKNAHAELLTRSNKFVQKQNDCAELKREISAKITGLEAEHTAAERDYICGNTDLKIVTALRQKLEAARSELIEAERLGALAAEAVNETDKQIAKSLQMIAIARRDFCIEESFKILEKIKQNKEFKGLILGAMAAFAANGQYHYTNNARKFMTDNIERILPEVTETEAREATETFQKMNDLD